MSLNTEHTAEETHFVTYTHICAMITCICCAYFVTLSNVRI